jgi:hypothetical protein
MDKRYVAYGLTQVFLLAGCARAPGVSPPSAGIPTMEETQATTQEVPTLDAYPTSIATIAVQPAVSPWPTFHGNLPVGAVIFLMVI